MKSVLKVMLAIAAGIALGSGAFAAPKTFVTIGSGSTTGLYYPTAVGMAKIVNDAGIDVRANARATGASVYNAKAIGSGELQMGIMQNNVAKYAYSGEGIEAFKGQPVENLRGMAALYPEVVHILARKDANIETVADLKGKRVYVGDVGSGTEQDAINILGAYDVGFDDLRSVVRGDAGNAVGLLRDGRIDAMLYTININAAAINEAAQTTPIVVVPISTDKIDGLYEKFPFYTAVTIPAKTYPGMDEDISTITLKAMLAADAKLPDEAVYEFMKTVFGDHLEQFYNDIQNPNLKTYFKLDNALDGMPIPLHPGAAKFYKEAGIDVPDDLTAPAE